MNDRIGRIFRHQDQKGADYVPRKATKAKGRKPALSMSVADRGSDISFFDLSLVNAEGKGAFDPNCRVAFLDTQQNAVGGAPHVSFPGTRRFSLPAWPASGAVYCDITPSLYGTVKSKFFTPYADKPQNQEVTVLRDPDKWLPIFQSLSQLPTRRFQPFLDVLTNSLNADVKHGRTLGNLSLAFDQLQGTQETLAKMALLNLFAVTQDTATPDDTSKTWFSFVKQIVRIDRERFVAEVDSALYTVVSDILSNLSKYASKGYFTESASMHYDNIPPRYVLASSLITIKIRYEQGNLQLTLGRATVEGNEVVLLDCDMDEHSNVIQHAGDLFLHVFSGGTHPIDMHEYIVHEDPNVDLGYELQAAASVMSVAAGS